jgi:hypothetical protein
MKRNKNNKLLLQPKEEPTISYQTFQSGITVAESPIIKKPAKYQIVPISNIPHHKVTTNEQEDGVPSARDFALINARRQITELRQEQKQLLSKLTRCLEVITDTKRFIELGLHYDQWETYDELNLRRRRLEAMISLIDDPVAHMTVTYETKKGVK